MNQNIDCKNKYCIYEKKDKCCLENISLNFSGICDNCIYVYIDDKKLPKLKLEMLSEFRERF